MLKFCFIVLIVWDICLAQEELFRNPNFEDPFDDQENWWCNRCTLTKSTDAQAGEQSGYISARDAPAGALSQYVDLEPGEDYYVIAYVKLLNLEPGYMYHNVRWLVHFTYTDGENQHLWLGNSPYNHPDNGWHMIGSDFTVPDKEIETARVYVSLAESENINYLVDSATMKKITHNANWRDEANARIEELRKSDLSINVQLSEGCEAQAVSLQLNMTGHTYPWGTCVKADWMAGDEESERKYQQTFYDNFNWAVLENMLKWRQMERNRGSINFDRADAAIEALQQGGCGQTDRNNKKLRGRGKKHQTQLEQLTCRSIPIRGHTILWGNEGKNPDWFEQLPPEEWQTEIDRRVSYMLDHYAGRLEHWDINNEQIHGDIYEQATGNRYITDDFFHTWKQGDPETLTFLNDYSVVRSGLSTVPYLESAKRMLARGVPVDALGLQGHFVGRPNIDAVIHRLDILTQAGLPMWVTELDIEEADVHERAQGYEDIMRLLYSRPDVDGVLLWGFWRELMNKPNAALFEGPDLTPNEAGERWQHLLTEEWSTSAQFVPSSPDDNFGIRAYQGHYEIDVMIDGEVKETVSFELGSIGDTVDVQVQC